MRIENDINCGRIALELFVVASAFFLRKNDKKFCAVFTKQMFIFLFNHYFNPP